MAYVCTGTPTQAPTIARVHAASVSSPSVPCCCPCSSMKARAAMVGMRRPHRTHAYEDSGPGDASTCDRQAVGHGGGASGSVARGDSGRGSGCDGA